MRSILDHSIKVAARDTAQDPVGPGYLAPAIPDANAHVIGPRASLALGLRDTSVVAGLVAVAAFCQTHPKPKSLGLGKHRVLRRRARHHGRRHHPKHQKRKRYFAKVWHCGCSLQSEFHPWHMAGAVIPGLTQHGNVENSSAWCREIVGACPGLSTSLREALGEEPLRRRNPALACCSWIASLALAMTI
jgi:hypothetical protein